MAVDLSKVMDLADGLEIYKDLRDRIKNIPTPEVPVVGLLINGLVMPITENKYIKFGVQNGIQLTMGGAGDATVFNLEADLRDVQIDGVSIRSQGIANIPRGNASQLGVFKINNSEGIGVYSDGRLCINEASSTQIKTGTTAAKPIVPGNQHQSVFYALAKAAGSDMKNSDNAVGTYTDEAKQAIQKMLGFDGILGDFESSAVASKAYAIGETFIYNGKRYRATAAIAISDVITPGTNCELAPIDGHYVRRTDIATDTVAGVAKVGGNGLIMDNGKIILNPATEANCKAGTAYSVPITAYRQHMSVFYGLAKAAGADMALLSGVTVGQYPQAQIQAIQKLFGLDGIFGPFEMDSTADQAYSIGNTFNYNGKRYKATAAIAIGDTITPETNCELDPLDSHVIKRTEIGPGLIWHNNSMLIVNPAATSSIKSGTSSNLPVTPLYVPDAVFYGLSKLAGVDLKNGSDVVGVYPQNSKTAIQTMLGIEADIPLIEEVSGTTPSITGMPNVRYICGTCSLLTITPPASGSIVVRFTSGSTPTVLTVPNTVKFPVWFDYTSLEADTTYEIIITDGVYGGVMSWAD